MSNINNYALKQNTILYGKSHTYTIEKILGQGSFGITYLAMTQVKFPEHWVNSKQPYKLPSRSSS